jgi:outer membrane protein TolC
MRLPQIVIALVLLYAPPAVAKDLTWKECVDLARKANPELQSASEGVHAARYRTRAAYGPLFPQVTGNIDYTNGGRSSSGPGTLTPSTGGLIDGEDNSFYSFSLNARQNVFAGFRDKARIGQGRANEAIADADLRNARARVSFDLKSAFADLKFAQDSVRLADDVLRRRRDNRNLVELRFESGRENKGSLLLSRSYYEDATFDRQEAGNRMETARQRLAKALGVEDLDGARVSGTVPVSRPPALRAEAGVDPLMRETPDYRRAIGEIKFAREAVREARSAFFPSLDVNAAVGRQGDEWFPGDNRWSVGAGVSLPFFRGGQDYYNLKSAKALDRAAVHNQTFTETDVRARLVAAHKAFVDSIKRLEADKAFLEAASVRAEIARNKYDNGLISFEDWDIIENDLIDRQKRHLQSQRDRIVAEASWEQVQGRGIFE